MLYSGRSILEELGKIITRNVFIESTQYIAIKAPPKKYVTFLEGKKSYTKKKVKGN